MSLIESSRIVQININISCFAVDIKVHKRVRMEDFNQLNDNLRGRDHNKFLFAQEDINCISRVSWRVLKFLFWFLDPSKFLVQVFDERLILEFLENCEEQHNIVELGVSDDRG